YKGPGVTQGHLARSVCTHEVNGSLSASHAECAGSNPAGCSGFVRVLVELPECSPVFQAGDRGFKSHRGHCFSLCLRGVPVARDPAKVEVQVRLLAETLTDLWCSGLHATLKKSRCRFNSYHFHCSSSFGM